MNPPRRLRVLYLPTWYPTTENPQYAIFLKVMAEALSREHDVVVLPVPGIVSLLGGPRNWANRIDIESNGSSMYTIRVRGPNITPGWPDAEERTLRRLYRKGLKGAVRLLGGPPDLIHAQVASTGGYYGVLLARELGCPLVLTEQISRPELLLEKTRDRQWFQTAMREADVVMCLSPAQEEQLRKVGVNREIVIVPDLIDTDLFSPGTSPSRPPIRLITVGSLIERKGVAHLIDAVATLRNAGIDVALSVVGDGPLRAALEHRAASLDLVPTVHFHGSCTLEQIRDLLRESHLYVSPSLTESLGIAVIEALSVGLPSVVTRSGGPETFVTPDNGVVVEPGDPAELVRGVQEILDQPGRFEPERLHQIAVERFGVRSVTHRINEQYRRAMAGRRAPERVSGVMESQRMAGETVGRVPGVQFRNVWKRFHRGERHNSLRDLLPAWGRRLVGKAPGADELPKGDFWALQDISFRVSPGEALGIIGPNGAGKSTVLKTLTRILRPTRGECLVTGRVGALIEVAAGFHQDLTGRENIFLQGAIMGMATREIRRKFDEIVAFSGIEEFIDTPVKRYSSGMNARLGFSIAAHLDPDVLIIDEVLSVGDFAFQEQAFGRLKLLAKSGIPVVVVTHQLERVPELCTSAILLQHGTVARQGSPEECIEAYVRGEMTTIAPGDSPILFVSATRIDGDEQVPSGGLAQLRITGRVIRELPESLEPVMVRIRALSTGKLIFSTSNSRLKVPLPASGPFEVEVGLQLNVPAGGYLCETIAYDRMENREKVMGPVVRLDVSEGKSFWGTVQMNPVMSVCNGEAHPPSSQRISSQSGT